MNIKRNIIYLLIGILFGIVLTKGEAVSWYRIHEMFHFGSFWMYGIIGTAVVLGAVVIMVMKKLKAKSFYGEDPLYENKEKTVPRHLYGGIIFGLGWALTGACPGPLYILVGQGYIVMIVVILSAAIGAFVYGVLRDKLPH
jgi:hypothetical protein